MIKGTRKPKATSGDVAGTCAPFDPWTATFEAAEKAQAALGFDPRPDSPFFQWVEVQRLTASRGRVENGTGFDVLEAVAGCAQHGLAMPDWLARAYLNRYRQVQQLFVDSWDAEAAFGKPYPPKSQIGAMRRRRLQRHQVWKVVTDYVTRHPDVPMDPLWQAFSAKPGEITTIPPEIAEQVRSIGCTKSTAQKLYREACELHRLPDDHAIRAKQLPASSAQVAGRRKKA